MNRSLEARATARMADCPASARALSEREVNPDGQAAAVACIAESSSGGRLHSTAEVVALLEAAGFIFEPERD